MSEFNQNQASKHAQDYILNTLTTLDRAATKLHDAGVDSSKSVGELLVIEHLYPRAKQATAFDFAKSRVTLSFPDAPCTTSASIGERREALIFAYSYQMWCLTYLYDRTAIRNVCRHLTLLHSRDELPMEELERYATSIGRRIETINSPQKSVNAFTEMLRHNVTYSSEQALVPELSSFPDFMVRSALSRRFKLDFGNQNNPISIEEANTIYRTYHPHLQQIIPLPQKYVTILNSARTPESTAEHQQIKTP